MECPHGIKKGNICKVCKSELEKKHKNIINDLIQKMKDDDYTSVKYPTFHDTIVITLEEYVGLMGAKLEALIRSEGYNDFADYCYEMGIKCRQKAPYLSQEIMYEFFNKWKQFHRLEGD